MIIIFVIEKVIFILGLFVLFCFFLFLKDLKVLIFLNSVESFNLSFLFNYNSYKDFLINFIIYLYLFFLILNLRDDYSEIDLFFYLLSLPLSLVFYLKLIIFLVFVENFFYFFIILIIFMSGLSQFYNFYLIIRSNIFIKNKLSFRVLFIFVLIIVFL